MTSQSNLPLQKTVSRIAVIDKAQLNLSRKINSYQNNFKACYVCIKVIKSSPFPFIFSSFSLSLPNYMSRSWRPVLFVTAPSKEQLEWFESTSSRTLSFSHQHDNAGT